MDLAKIHFCGPQNPNIFSHKILVPEFLMKFPFRKCILLIWYLVGLRFFKLNCLEAREVQKFQNRVT